MLGIWTLVLSLVVLAGGIAATAIALRSENQIAIMVALDAAVLSGVGVLLNVFSAGELQLTGIVCFIVIPAVAAAAGALLGRFRPTPRLRYESTQPAAR
ncbi:hypothetical protein N1027_12730 [Herbiconiux sp. CPCC 205763]|uniref:Uncharacterized protein n=1 Tax=Herbiconiux aconitum TaxID=2970913 RepID=A0ABT2GS11_9MICO|nr:hypothetical protein [Herbiconiux aconitum]MCS5719000.1 hypothetical protein [Herbiconiux aconitum]